MNNVHNIEQLFSGRLFVVPDYQRGYAWDIVQLTEFLEDLDLLPQGKEHYTGTIILHEQDGASRAGAEGKRYSVVDIVDGQQRLTTILLLLDAIRRKPRSSGLSDWPRESRACTSANTTRTDNRYSSFSSTETRTHSGSILL